MTNTDGLERTLWIVARELKLLNKLYKIDMRLKYSDGTLKDEIEKALEELEE